MSLWVINKQAVAPFVANLMADYRVVGPVAKGKQFVFAQIEEPADLRLDYNTSILPPKKYLQPQEERMMTFNRVNGNVETVIEATPTVILGVHTCDLHAIHLLDKAFSEGYPDAHYLERRRNTLLVSIECLQPCHEHSFCKNMETLTAGTNYDLHLTDLGNAYAVNTGTEKGLALLKKYAEAYLAVEADMQTLNKTLSAKWPRFPYRLEFDIDELSTLVRQSYNSPTWDKFAEDCLACGTCNIVCPTCFCFNVYDEVELNLEDGERRRRWDSCMLDEFARVAGGENFREHRAARLRHRFMRKGSYMMQRHDLQGCVGCGRCASLCLADISPINVFNELHRARHQEVSE